MAWPSNSARTKTWATEILTSGDQHAQLDLLHQYFIDALNGSTGHAHTGGTNDGKKIALTTGVSGTLALGNGGTGVTTLAALGSIFYPVGSLYFNDEVSTNPATLLGFGTWTAIVGKGIIGIDSGDTDIDTAKKTGGAKTSSALIAHTHNVKTSTTVGGGTTYVRVGVAATEGVAQATESAGSGSSFSIMNPFYAAYVWRRAS